MKAHVARFKAFKQSRSRARSTAPSPRSRAPRITKRQCVRGVVEAAEVGVTHGEIVGCLRKELGFGRPLIVA